jgi:hypothetical protein
MNIFQVAFLFIITLKCVTATGVPLTESEQGTGQHSPVTGTAPISSTVEDDPDPVSQAQASPSGQLVSRTRKRKRVSNHYQTLVAGVEHGKIARLRGMSRYTFVMNLCPLMTTIQHYNGLHKLIDGNKLIPYLLVYGNVELVRRVIHGDGVPEKNLLTSDNLKDALVLSFHQERHKRFIEIVTAEEHQHIESGAHGNLPFLKVSISSFYEAIDPENSKTFKHFLTYHGDELHSKYHISYKFLCKDLTTHFYFKDWSIPSSFRLNSLFKDFLGQPFPFPPEAILEGVPHLGYATSSDVQDFLSSAPPREVIEKALLESDDRMKRRVWEEIVKRFSLPDPTFPPSPEALESVLKRFRSKADLEKAWSREHEHRFKEMVPKRSKEMLALLLSLNLLPDVLMEIVARYAALTRFSWFGPI